MNPTPIPPAPSRRRLWLVVTVTLILAVPLFIALGVLSCLRLGSDAAALRQSVIRSAPKNWSRKVEFSLGRIPLALARSGLRFANLDAEARLALDALRGADVAVYQGAHDAAMADPPALLAATDSAMKPRGWERAVTVVQAKEFVVIYVPKDVRATDDLRVCLVVLDRDEMVVASVRGQVEPLLELIQERPEMARLTALKR
jgi:hypothetical protein